MPRKKATLNVSTFAGGLITEASELAFPDNAAKDLLNCDVLPTAEVIRRLGVDFESGYSLSTDAVTDTELLTYAISTHEWKSVAGKGSRQFLVVQMGNTLYFYDQAITPLGDGAKSFTVDLDTYLSPAATDSSTYEIDATPGRGFLFVVSEAINPITIEYDPVGDSISVTEITFKVRDLEGVDDSLDINDEPTTLSTEHEYNLKNQGWVAPSYDPIDTFKTQTTVYPSNTQVPWQAINTSTSKVDGVTIRNEPASTSEAAKGRYLLNPFYRDRSTVSGVSGLTTVTTDSRPNCIAFFSGRVAYAGVTDGPHAGDVFISEVINATASNAGRCYQVGDPTSEDDSALVASDGVVVPIPEAGNIVALASMGTALLVLASNGVWAISGVEGGGFKATAFQVNRTAGEEAGCVSKASVVDLGGAPAWAAQTGIYGTQIDNVTLQPTVSSLTDKTIKTFYQSINALDRTNIIGKYDKVGKKVYWFYKDRDVAPASSSPYYCEKALVFNTLTGAFMPYTISSLASDSPFICGVYDVPQISNITVTDPVTVGGTQVTEQGNDVTVPIASAVRSVVLTGLLIMVPNSGNTNNNFTFGQFLNTGFLDWEQADSTGIDYSSYVEVAYYTLGDTAKNKQAPYVISHFRRTETGFIADPGGGDGYVFLNPSSCTLQAKWDWTDSTAAGKWSTAEQAYRFHRPYVVDEGDLSTFDDGYEVNTSKIKVPGKGRALALKYASVAGKDFRLMGWVIDIEGATSV